MILQTFNFADNGRHLANQHYRVCMRQEAEMCSIMYQPCDEQSFRIGPAGVMRDDIAMMNNMLMMGGAGMGGVPAAANGMSGLGTQSAVNGMPGAAQSPAGMVTMSNNIMMDDAAAANTPSVTPLIMMMNSIPSSTPITMASTAAMPASSPLSDDAAATTAASSPMVSMPVASSAMPAASSAMPAASSAIPAATSTMPSPTTPRASTTSAAPSNDDPNPSSAAPSTTAQPPTTSAPSTTASTISTTNRVSSTTTLATSTFSSVNDEDYFEGSGDDSLVQSPPVSGPLRRPRPIGGGFDLLGFLQSALGFRRSQRQLKSPQPRQFFTSCRDRVTMPCIVEDFIGAGLGPLPGCEPVHCGSQFCSSGVWPCRIESTVTPFYLGIHFGEGTNKGSPEENIGACLRFQQVQCM